MARLKDKGVIGNYT